MTVRVAFLGSADFSVPALRAVAKACEVGIVVTQPDRRGDRGRPAPRPVAEVAAELGLALWQPERLRTAEAADHLIAMNLDALIVAAYGQILPGRLLAAPRFGGINVHASLLPRWRGASPVAAAIMAGDAQTGVSIMRMEAGLDTGPVFASRSVPISATATTPELTAQLAVLGAEVLISVIERVAVGALEPTPQDEAAATYAPRLAREDGHLRWDVLSGEEIDRRVRALQPWPGVSMPLQGDTVRLLRGAPDPRSGIAGTVLAREGADVVVAAAEGSYRITRVQRPGGRPMTAGEYLRGRRI